MPRHQPSRALSLLLGLSSSACAFGALAYHARADSVSQHALRAPEATPSRASLTITEPKRNGADLVAPATVPKHGLIVVPSFEGKRVSKARREARALGLKLVAFTTDGERIRGELGPIYRIDSQQVAAGERLPPGAPISVRAHEVEPLALGY